MVLTAVLSTLEQPNIHLLNHQSSIGTEIIFSVKLIYSVLLGDFLNLFH